MLELLKSQLAQQNIKLSSKKIICGISGGIDSMVLLDLLVKLECIVIAAHVNYKTRANDSDLDQALVETYCKNKNLKFEALSVDLKQEIKESNENFQAKARKLRYDFFQKIKTQEGADFIATAHHQNDQLENIMLNLFRGVGPKSMLYLNGDLIRPLLRFKKADIEKYAELENIPFREDCSNAQNKYDRNFLRNEIIPNLEHHFPFLFQKLNSFSERYYLDQKLVSDLLQTEISPKIKKADIQSARHLFHLIKSKGFSWEHSKEIYNAIDSVGARFESHSNKISIGRKLLLIEELESPKLLETKKLSTLPFSCLTENGMQISLALVERPTEKKGDYIYLSPASFPLEIRSWREGDSFQAIGMNGKTKKIKKLFVDKKIETWEKHLVPILVDSQNVIVYVLGVQKDHRFAFHQEGKFCVEVLIS